MQAIVFANRNGNELAPLNQHYCPALLPVANKALVEYTLEDLAAAGITDVKMVVCHEAQNIESKMGNGEQWGLTINYFLSKPEEQVNSVLSRMNIDKTAQALVVRGDMLRSPCLARFIEFSRLMPSKFVHAKMDQRNPAMMMLPAGWKHNQLLNWPLETTEVDHNNSVAQVLHGECFYIDSLAAYVKASEYVINSQDFCVKGRVINTNNAHQSLVVEAQCQLPDLSETQAYGAIGEYTKVSNKAKLSQGVVVGEYCFIEDSQIQDSIILPNTYVGPQLCVENKIISQDLIIDPVTNSWTKVEDQSLIAKSTQETTNYNGIFQRAVLLTLYVLLSPLLLALFLGSLMLKPRKPIVTESVINNEQQPVKAHKFNIKSPSFALLPQVWLVIKGDLNLFGASTKYQNKQDGNSTYGVYGPVQLNFDENTPIEEIQMVEMEFEQSQKPLYLMSMLQKQFDKTNAAIEFKS
ncbi:NDP-sugar synthase [Shewanella olleyana]|uniref:sugar phosphate nucleotidyltransferase n=1 Tax=Shewanella olleyana TaxID=135626 RepID=UPI00200CA7A9|nr:NDP-sugar synthase [Shewanella olleyana]MCL1067125.1 NDP-sugar synthase [Shewanella olleyana]